MKKTMFFWGIALCSVNVRAKTTAADFRVRDFGAKGDGVTKDTAAVQAADVCAQNEAWASESSSGAQNGLSKDEYDKLSDDLAHERMLLW